MKILVTGHKGFLGQRVANRLTKLGHEVEGYSLEDGNNILNYNKLSEAVKRNELVFHLAAQTDVRKSFNNPNQDYLTNYIGTRNVAQACGKYRKHLIYTSSAAVYGDTKEVPTKEDSPKLPFSYYGLHKLLAEIPCVSVNAFIIRPFNIYGAKGHSVINKFIDLLQKKQDIQMFNNGDCTRDYIYVEDVVDALLLGMNKNGVFNIGSGKETSLDDLIKIISKQFGAEPKFKVEGTVLGGEIKRSVANISKAKARLNWEPKTSLEDGIKHIVTGV